MDALFQIISNFWNDHSNEHSHSTARFFGLLLGFAIFAFYFIDLLLKNQKAQKKSSEFAATPPRRKSTRERKGPTVCPFSAETNFIVETAEHLPPAPLDLYESWINPSNKNDFGKPVAALWLNAGISGQDTPGVARAGLKRLRDSKFFLVEEPFRIKEELLMKQKALDDPKRRDRVFVAEPDSILAQQEVLELLLSYLPRRYPEMYKYDQKRNILYVAPIDMTFNLAEWDDRPLELCERIVQEDLILVRPPRQEEGEDKSTAVAANGTTTHNNSNNDQHHKEYVLAAGGVVFSFGALPEKLSKPMTFIHAPVPAYESQLRKTLDLTFSKLLKVKEPLWRNNWSIDPTGMLDQRPDSHGFTEGNALRNFSHITVDDIKSKYLAVEYQTIRRLPTSGYLLFTVKVMSDPMHSLEQVPQAAKCLAKSIRGMSPAMRQYKGIKDGATARVVLEYLDSISAGQ